MEEKDKISQENFKKTRNRFAICGLLSKIQERTLNQNSLLNIYLIYFFK